MHTLIVKQFLVLVAVFNTAADSLYAHRDRRFQTHSRFDSNRTVIVDDCGCNRNVITAETTAAQFEETTCSKSAYARGSGQKVSSKYAEGDFFHLTTVN